MRVVVLLAWLFRSEATPAVSPAVRRRRAMTVALRTPRGGSVASTAAVVAAGPSHDDAVPPHAAVLRIGDGLGRVGDGLIAIALALFLRGTLDAKRVALAAAALATYAASLVAPDALRDAAGRRRGPAAAAAARAAEPATCDGRPAIAIPRGGAEPNPDSVLLRGGGSELAPNMDEPTAPAPTKDGAAPKEAEAAPQKFWGMPMRWESDKAFKNLWNKEDDRIFPPKYYGIGWSINFHALGRSCGLISTPKPATATPASPKADA
mmetsp:Transcript_26605/g.106574  ORF Transcript_26605/g.106574 Transcript_26605/m.106574 type:complete len:264 (-) Transcript_26605:174-965(-)